MKGMTLIAVGIIVFLRLGQVYAFPDFVRHQYLNCTTCHMSPSGGNILTDYGRALSSELVSQFGDEKEAQLLHGQTGNWKRPDWLLLGGQIRVLQIHKETPQTRSGATIPMQAEVEFGLKNESWAVLVSLFKLDPIEHTIKSELNRAYVLYQAENGYMARVGKFTPNFGLLMPYHTLATRDGIGMGRNSERLLVEQTLIQDRYSISFGVGTEEKKSSTTDKPPFMVVAQGYWNFIDSGKVGVGFIDDGKKQRFSLNALWGLNQRLTYLTDFVYSLPSTNASSTQIITEKGLAHFSQLVWEQSKGINYYFIEDYLRTNQSDDTSLSDLQGVGVRYHPRPHFDIDAQISRKRVVAIDDRYDGWLWIQGHYYF